MNLLHRKNSFPTQRSRKEYSLLVQKTCTCDIDGRSCLDICALSLPQVICQAGLDSPSLPGNHGACPSENKGMAACKSLLLPHEH